MPSLVQREVRPYVREFRGGQSGGTSLHQGDVFSGFLNCGLSGLNESVEGFGIDEVFEATVERCVPFAFSFGQHPDRRFKLGVAIGTDRPGCFEIREESIGHVRVELAGADRHRVGASRRVLPPAGFTPVVDCPTDPHGGFEGVSAAGAPNDPGQKPGAAAVASGGDSFTGVGGFERGAVHDRFVTVQVDDVLAGVDLPEIRPVADQVAGCPDAPFAGGSLGKPVGDCRPGLTGGTSLECFFDEGGFRSGSKPPGVVFDVAKWDGSADEHAAFHGVRSSNKPRFALPVNFELSDGAHDGRDHASGPAAGVDSFRDCVQGGVVGGENVKEFPEVADGSAEPVEFRDDHPVTFTGLDGVHDFVETGPVAFLAGLVEVFVNVVDMLAVKVRPALDGFALFSGTDESFAFSAGYSADSDVPSHAHAPLTYNALESSCSSGRAWNGLVKPC